MKLMPNWKSHFAKPGATHRPNPAAEQASAQPAAGIVASAATATATATVTEATDATGTDKPVVTPPRAGGRRPGQSHKQPSNASLPQNQPDVSWRETYLELLEINGGQKTAAARGSNITLKTVCQHRNMDPEFAAAEKMAMKAADDVCEAEARRRAIDGTTSTVTTTLKDGSVRVYSETKYSDTILLRLLEKNETGSWRQKQQIEHSGGMSFKTEAERKAALEKARAIRDDKPVPVEAINGRS